MLVVLLLVLADRWGLFGLRPAPEADDRTRYHGRTLPVVRVIDGDTIDVGLPDGRHRQTRVRLCGVDTPETKHPRKPQQHFGAEATDFTRGSCAKGPVTLKLLPQGTRDDYGRLLAYVILPDGRMLNRELVRQGYGYADPRYDHPHRAEFLGLQAEARRRRLGLWLEARPADLPYYLSEANRPGP